MSYINYRRNNDTHLVETLAEFELREDAVNALPTYRVYGSSDNIYISRRATQEWHDRKLIGN